jgi:hypothetical protein
VIFPIPVEMLEAFDAVSKLRAPPRE